MKKKLKEIKNSRIVKVLFARKSVVFCLIVLAVLILAAIFAPLITVYDPYKQDLTSMLQGVSLTHPLGTDSMGRDLLTRIIYGGRISFCSRSGIRINCRRHRYGTRTDSRYGRWNY